METSLWDFGRCEAGGCTESAVVLTEEGYRWCAEHARAFYLCVAVVTEAVHARRHPERRHG